MENGSEKIISLANDVFSLAKSILSVNMRFLNMAISVLEPVSAKGTPATDGEHLYFDPVLLLREYKRERNTAARSYLHMLFHCIFRHFFVSGGNVNRDYWDLACDIAVENIINELEIPSVTVKRCTEQQREITALKRRVDMLTAEKLYRYFSETSLSAEECLRLRALFFADDHSCWYENGFQEPCDGSEPDAPESADKNRNGGSDPDAPSDTGESSDENEEPEGSDSYTARREELKKKWEEISELMQTELETFSRQQGDESGGLMQNLAEVNREKYDYTAFLRKFAVYDEAMKINDDDFDYIFYTYGLEMYGNMPLIEPLEYKEVKKIREFVIAIDTSGSVSGKLIGKFIQKTYNILKSEESFFRKINLHIIQCDAEVKQDVKITSEEDFDSYIGNMTLHGFGGTDFRPVFSYVEELIAKREFINLRGLIYLTDGNGIFPEKQPPYSTAFVYVDDDYNNYEVPVWAIKLILKSDEI